MFDDGSTLYLAWARSVIEVIVQLGRQGSERGIVAIEQLSAVGPRSRAGAEIVGKAA